MRHYRIVAALDETVAASSVLRHALDQAARHEMPEIHLLAIAGSEDEIPRLETWLAEVSDTLGGYQWAGAAWQTHLHVRTGARDDEIANLAGELDADLIVVARHRLRDAICPVLVVGLAHDTPPPCAVCAAVREESHGACWYCARHDRDSRTVLTMPVASPHA